MNQEIKWNDDVLTVQGHLDDLARWFRNDLAPGTSAWQRRDGFIKAIVFVCPCGCGGVVSIPVASVPEPSLGCVWMWDGNELYPTLSPSILRLDNCGWHGNLTKGIFTPC